MFFFLKAERFIQALGDNRVIGSFRCSCWATVSDSLVHSWDEEPSWNEKPVCGYSNGAFAAIYLICLHKPSENSLPNSTKLPCLFFPVSKQTSRNIESSHKNYFWYMQKLLMNGKNCSKQASCNFQQKLKNPSRCDYSFSSTSRVSPLFPTQHVKPKEWLTLLPAPPCLDDRTLEIISEVSCVRSWIFEWAEGGCIKEKKKKGEGGVAIIDT